MAQGRPRHPAIRSIPIGMHAAAYVVEFTGGVVKIGHSSMPRVRLEVLTDEARRNKGLEVVRVHIGREQVRSARSVEWRVLSRIWPIANRLGKAREYFTGLSFEDAVRIVDEESATTSALPA